MNKHVDTLNVNHDTLIGCVVERQIFLMNKPFLVTKQILRLLEWVGLDGSGIIHMFA